MTFRRTTRTSPETFLSSARHSGEILPELPLLDKKASLERLGGNVRSYLQLLQKFSDNQKTAIEELKYALVAGDESHAALLIHTLKGLSATIGADVLNRLTVQLETRVKTGNCAPGDSLVGQTNAELAKIIQMIENIPAIQYGNGEANSHHVSSSVVDQLIALSSKVDDYDSSAEDDLYMIMDLVKGHPAHSELQTLAKAVSRYDFEVASEQLNNILSGLALQDVEDE